MAQATAEKNTITVSSLLFYRRGIVISAAEALSATALAALGLATVGAVAASASMLGDVSRDPRRLTSTGMTKFRANKVEESVVVGCALLCSSRCCKLAKLHDCMSTWVRQVQCVRHFW